jgi:VanZ family protein
MHEFQVVLGHHHFFLEKKSWNLMMAWETKELFTIYFSFWKSNSEDEGVIAVDALANLWQYLLQGLQLYYLSDMLINSADSSDRIFLL